MTQSSTSLVLSRVLVSGPCCCVASTEGYNFWEAHVRPLRWTQGGSARRVRSPLALRERGAVISPLAHKKNCDGKIGGLRWISIQRHGDPTGGESLGVLGPYEVFMMEWWTRPLTRTAPSLIPAPYQAGHHIFPDARALTHTQQLKKQTFKGTKDVT